MTAATEAKAGGRLKNGLAWIVFVFLVPAVFALVLLGVVLQLVGVPVMKTVEHQLGLSKPVVTKTLAPSPAALLQVEQQKYSQLESAKQAVVDRLSVAEAQNQSLQKQIAAVQAKLNARVAAAQAAKKEANILVAMDPSQAAPLLARMSVPEAAAVVAQMSASDAGPILAILTPAKSDTIMAKAAQLAQ